MVKESTHMKSFGELQDQSNKDSSTKEQLQKQLDYLHYQNALRDELLFRDLLLRQLQIMNQSLIEVKEEIIKASSGEESNQTQLPEMLTQKKLKAIEYDEEEENEDEEEEDDQASFERSKPKPKLR